MKTGRAQNADAIEGIFAYLGYGGEEGRQQIAHRLALCDAWEIKPSQRIIEIGCGQGNTTLLLADAVGPRGRITAIDSAPRDYGYPITLGDAHAAIATSVLGDRITFVTSCDTLSSGVDTTASLYDMAVFSHCAWYMSSEAHLARLFGECRSLVLRLGYAEWDLALRDLGQCAHAIAALLQWSVRVKRRAEGRDEVSSNIRWLATTPVVKAMLHAARWEVTSEQVVDTSSALRYGRSEVRRALDMIARDASFMELDVLSSTLAEVLRTLVKERPPASLATRVLTAV